MALFLPGVLRPLLLPGLLIQVWRPASAPSLCRATTSGWIAWSFNPSRSGMIGGNALFARPCASGCPTGVSTPAFVLGGECCLLRVRHVGAPGKGWGWGPLSHVLAASSAAAASGCSSCRSTAHARCWPLLRFAAAGATQILRSQPRASALHVFRLQHILLLPADVCCLLCAGLWPERRRHLGLLLAPLACRWEHHHHQLWRQEHRGLHVHMPAVVGS